MEHPLQYGFFIKRAYNSPIEYCLLEDTCSLSLAECMDEAFACFQNGESILNIFSIDTKTGTLVVLHDALDTDEIMHKREEEV